MLEKLRLMEQSIKLTAFHTQEAVKHTQDAANEANLTAWHVKEYLNAKRCNN